MCKKQHGPSIINEIDQSLSFSTNPPKFDSISVIQVDLSTLSPTSCSDSTVNKYSVRSEVFVIYVLDQLLYLCPLIIYFTDTISMNFNRSFVTFRETILVKARKGFFSL